MSIYKGGYILADISDNALSGTAQDLLPQDLKDYLSKYIVNEVFTKEVLYKPIVLIIKHADNTIERMEMKVLASSGLGLFAYTHDIDGNNIKVTIYITLTVQEDTI